MACRLKVFLSHSASNEDKGLVDGIRILAEKRAGIDLYIAERDKQPGCDINEKIEKKLDWCDCVWALLTPKGNLSAFVQNEVGAAHIIKRRIIPMLEEGQSLQGMLGGLTEYVQFDRTGQISPIEDTLDGLERDCEEIKRKLNESSDELVKGLNLRIKEIEEENAKLRKDQEEVELSISTASTADTKDKQLWDLAYELGMRGRHAAAEALFAKYVEKYPDVAEGHNNLGVALEAQGKINEAITEYRETIQLKPEWAEPHYNLGLAQRKLEKTDDAIAGFREAIRLKPAFVEARNNLGGTLAERGKTEEAIAEFREVIRLRQDHARAHSNLGAALSEQGKPGEAIVEIREAIRLKPDLAEAHNNLGVAFWKLEKADEAIEEYREAIRLNIDFANALKNLAIALDFLGKRKEARGYWERVLKLEKRPEWMAAIEQRLAELD